ncbi:ankyrin repeat domain-containing protein [Cohnella cellulosilytica]|uniref:Ankyrin repeat domain-containing protein n=1 Tax=Cohnella cellulosilytica TaxID=986710 RepID=A0ABW2FC11_9BACL
MTEQSNKQNNRFCTSCGVQLQAGMYFHACGTRIVAIDNPTIRGSALIQKQGILKRVGGIKWLAVPLLLAIVFAVIIFNQSTDNIPSSAEPVHTQSSSPVTIADTAEDQRNVTDDKYLNLDKIKLKSLLQTYTEQNLTYGEVTDGYILLLSNPSETFSFTLTGENLDHVESVIISLNPSIESNVELLSAAFYYLLRDESEFNDVARWLDNQIRSALASGKDMLNSDDPPKSNLVLEDQAIGFTALFYNQFMISISREKIVLDSPDVTTKEKSSQTPLATEAEPESGPYFNTTDADLLKAVRNGDTQAVSTLLKQGARPDVVDEMFITPLMEAAREGHMEMVKALLEYGASPNLHASNNETALMWAVDGGYLEIVKLLLEVGADPNVTGDWYRTSLMSAAKNGYTDIAKALLQAGADTSPKIDSDIDNRTALQMATDAGHTEIAELIRKAEQTH